MTSARQVVLAGRCAAVATLAAVIVACAQQPLEGPTKSTPRLDKPEFAGDHIVVKLDKSTSEEQLRMLAGSIGGREVTRPSFADFYYVALNDGVDPVNAAQALSVNAGVVYAEADPKRYPLFAPNDPAYQLQWHLQKLDMEKAWDINAGSTSDIVVAVLDAGVAFADVTIQYPEGKIPFAQASDLNGTAFVHPYNFIWDDAYPVDLDGHGTHVTGTIAQRTNNASGAAGMAFNVSIMPVKVILGGKVPFLDCGYGGGCTLDEFLGLRRLPYGASTVARGIRYAVDNGANVINMSLGGTTGTTAERDALQYAVDHGVFVAIAAGNSAKDGNPVLYPGRFAQDIEGVVAVGAVDFNFQRASYSEIQSYVEVAAPGGDTSADANHDREPDGVFQQTIDPVGLNEYFAYATSAYPRPFNLKWPPDLRGTTVLPYQGTSMASPHVAGLAALLMSQGLTSPRVIEAAMKRFATDVAPAGRDDETGYGVINPRATLLGLGLAR
jgi:serine protease